MKRRTEYASSSGVTSALYVSTGGKWVSTRVPSMPSHQNVEWGNRFVRFHDSFWVTNRRIPPAAKTCGRPAGYPKTSGIHTSVQRRPKCDWNQRCPWTIWRTMLSPDGRFMSGSTHMPPTGIHCPAVTLSVMRANNSGSRWAIHSYCCACEHENR